MNGLQTKLLLAEAERDDVIRAAARLADALQEIFNNVGFLVEVEEAYNGVYVDVSHYKSLTEKGLKNEQ